MASLQQLVQAARTAEVDRPHAQRYVRALLQQHSLAGDTTMPASQTAAAPRRWWQAWFGGLLLGGVTTAAALTATLYLGAPRAYVLADVATGARAPLDAAAMLVNASSQADGASSTRAASPALVVRYGAHVALASAPNARVAVVSMTATETVIHVAGGMVASRVQPHAGHVLVIMAERGVLHIERGEVVLPSAEPPVLLSGVATWHASAARAGEPRGSVVALKPQPHVFAAAEQVVSAVRAYHFVDLAILPESAAAAFDTGAMFGDDSQVQAGPRAPSPAHKREPTNGSRVTAAASPEPSASPIAADAESQWRRVRLLRGQARYEEALVVAQELARSKDPVWAPIAALEMARIQLGPLGNAAAAQPLLADWLASYPHHPLHKQAQQMLCQAAAQVGKRLPSCASTP